MNWKNLYSRGGVLIALLLSFSLIFFDCSNSSGGADGDSSKAVLIAQNTNEGILINFEVPDNVREYEVKIGDQYIPFISLENEYRTAEDTISGSFLYPLVYSGKKYNLKFIFKDSEYKEVATVEKTVKASGGLGEMEIESYATFSANDLRNGIVKMLRAPIVSDDSVWEKVNSKENCFLHTTIEFYEVDENEKWHWRGCRGIDNNDVGVPTYIGKHIEDKYKPVYINLIRRYNQLHYVSSEIFVTDSDGNKSGKLYDYSLGEYKKIEDFDGVYVDRSSNDESESGSGGDSGAGGVDGSEDSDSGGGSGGGSGGSSSVWNGYQGETITMNSDGTFVAKNIMGGAFDGTITGTYTNTSDRLTLTITGGTGAVRMQIPDNMLPLDMTYSVSGNTALFDGITSIMYISQQLEKQ